MRDGWKQVDAQEFAILSRFHPTEIRYYVDFSTAVRKRAPVEVVASPSGNGAVRPEGRKTGYLIGSPNKTIKLSVKTGNVAIHEGTIRETVYKSIRKILKNDLKAGIPRQNLVASIANDTKLNANQIQPQISDLIAESYLVALSA